MKAGVSAKAEAPDHAFDDALRSASFAFLIGSLASWGGGGCNGERDFWGELAALGQPWLRIFTCTTDGRVVIGLGGTKRQESIGFMGA
jgi:hypothetical protein